MDDEKYHYVECGLNDVYLLNGFERQESPRGSTVSIRDVDMLHKAIGLFLCNQRKDLNGKEIRFLRLELLMPQAKMARYLRVSEQTIYRWETGKCRMPKAAESILRLLYREQQENGGGSIKECLKEIADLEDEIDRIQEMNFSLEQEPSSKRPTSGASLHWKLAA